MKKIATIIGLSIAAILAIPCSVTAEVAPIPMPSDTKLVTFSYDPNNTYTIVSRPRNVTDIVLAPSETVVAFAMGDTVQWMVQEAPGHVFVKPINPGIVTSGTLVTNQRTYQLSFRASPEDGVFYQRVSWHYPELIVLRQQQAMAIKESVNFEKARLSATIASSDVNPETLNFSYDVDGEAPWKPVQVFDDGKFTWVRLGKNQDIPAFFARNEENNTDLVNTNIRGEYVVVQRILPQLLLKLGSKEVVITNRKLKKSFFSFGGVEP